MKIWRDESSLMESEGNLWAFTEFERNVGQSDIAFEAPELLEDLFQVWWADDDVKISGADDSPGAPGEGGAAGLGGERDTGEGKADLHSWHHYLGWRW